MTQHHLFEGPEKKVELILRPSATDLRELGRPFWERIVQAAHASILSEMGDGACRAYLLSESSLFVWRDRIIMITCGRTSLVEAVEALIDELPKEEIALLTYERKNEHFPEEQPTTFHEDARRLNARMSGQALRFGAAHEHRVYLFVAQGMHEPPEDDDVTLEILMHDIDPRWMQTLSIDRSIEGETIAKREGIDRLLPGFSFDEHLFDPTGYSMNAIRGEEYCTIHVTPQRVGSYVSFETNIDFRDDLVELVRRVVTLFGARSFDVVTFLPDSEDLEVEIPGYRLRKHVEDRVADFQVCFRHFYRPPKNVESAFRMRLG